MEKSESPPGGKNAQNRFVKGGRRKGTEVSADKEENLFQGFFQWKGVMRDRGKKG